LAKNFVFLFFLFLEQAKRHEIEFSG